MGWLRLVLVKIRFVLHQLWYGTPIKAARLWYHFSINSLKAQKNAWGINLLAYLFDMLLLPEAIDSFWQLLKPRSRSLNALELAEAKKVFGDLFPYQQVRIDEHSLIAIMGAAAQKASQMGVSTFYTINFSRRLHTYLPLSDPAAAADMGWLIHELVHVAQMHFVGSRYMWEAIAAQHSPQGYDYGKPAQLTQYPLQHFNREQQGDIVRHYYDYVLCENTSSYIKNYYQATYYQHHIAQLREGQL